MGSKNSKEIGQEEEEEEDSAYDPLKIQWDKYGNLRYGESHTVSPAQQLIEIMELDYETDDRDTDKVWYLVDSVWLASWLSYVHRNIWQAPAPGPCRNDRLIKWDPEQNKYIGRFGLMMATQYNPRGDYRKISKLTWEKYKLFYPDSGPAITLTLNETNIKMDSDQYPLIFNILDPPLPPVVKITKRMKKKLAKLNKLNESNKSNKSTNNNNNNTSTNNIDMEFEIKEDDEEYESSMIPPKENESIVPSQDASNIISKNDTILTKKSIITTTSNNNNNNNNNVSIPVLPLQETTNSINNSINNNNNNNSKISFSENSPSNVIMNNNNLNKIPSQDIVSNSSNTKDSSLTSTNKSFQK